MICKKSWKKKKLPKEMGEKGETRSGLIAKDYDGKSKW